MYRTIGFAWLAATLSTGAFAQTMYKCQVGGKVQYTDRPCDVGVEVKRIAPDGGPTREDQERARMRVRSEQARYTAQDAAAAPVNQGISQRQDVRGGTDTTRRRRELEMVLSSLAADKETKRAARDELDRLQRGVAPQLTQDEEQSAKNLRAGLNSIDSDTRKKAERAQRDLYDKYESKDFLANRARDEEAERKLRQAREQRAAQAAAQAASTTPITLTDGRVLVPSGGGFTDPRNGTFYSNAAGGIVNSRTGGFIPVP